MKQSSISEVVVVVGYLDKGKGGAVCCQQVLGTLQYWPQMMLT